MLAWKTILITHRTLMFFYGFHLHVHVLVQVTHAPSCQANGEQGNDINETNSLDCHKGSRIRQQESLAWVSTLFWQISTYCFIFHVHEPLR